ncbi:MAG: DeoR/GlpR family DNA-binding transcription regulator [Nostocoides sp.]
MTLIPAQRQESVLAALRTEGTIPLRDLAERLGVSVMTVRRDIRALEESGLVRPVSGGVQLAQGRQPPVERGRRRTLERARKEAIARAVAAEVPRGATLYLDAGTTCQAVAAALPEGLDLTVLTRDLHTALLVGERAGVDVYLVGGRLDPHSGATDGSMAALATPTMVTDLCVLGTGAFDGQHGITTTSPDKVAVKLAAMSHTSKVVLAADSTKFGAVARFRVAALEDVDLVVSDSELPVLARSVVTKRVPFADFASGSAADD